MAKKEYQPQIGPESSACCALCGWKGTQATLKLHLAAWDDDADPIKPQCPGVRFYIDPDPLLWTTVDTYAVLTRKNILAGMNPKKAAREAGIAVGYKERAKPMTDEVKTMLKERNEQKRELRESMKRRSEAKSKNPRSGRRKKGA